MLSSIIVVKRRSHPVLKPLQPGPKLATTTVARLKRDALVIASVLVLVSPTTGHAITADEVLIVVNDRSAISQQIGERYRTVRGVPPSQVVRIHTEATEEIDRSTFGAEIAQPIAAHLLNHRLQDRILVIVLTKGVPLKIRGTEGRQGTQASVDSELTLLYRVLVQGAADAEGRVANPYFRPGLPAPFTRATSDIYLVTRLDGYTLEDVLELIERAGKPAGARTTRRPRRAPRDSSGCRGPSPRGSSARALAPSPVRRQGGTSGRSAIRKPITPPRLNL